MSQTLDITEAQAATLTRSKTKLVKETTTQMVDSQTGELLTSTDQTTTMASTEPDYIKVYYRTVLAFEGIKDIPVDFLLAMSHYITWVSDTEPMLYKSDRITSEHVCDMCSIKIDMYRKYIARCRKSGLLILKAGYRGVYEVNPFFIARGRWDSIRKLRATFDFCDGHWCKHVEEDDA